MCKNNIDQSGAKKFYTNTVINGSLGIFEIRAFDTIKEIY